MLYKPMIKLHVIVLINSKLDNWLLFDGGLDANRYFTVNSSTTTTISIYLYNLLHLCFSLRSWQNVSSIFFKVLD